MKFPHQTLFLVIGISTAAYAVPKKQNLRRAQTASHPCSHVLTEPLFNTIAPLAVLPYSHAGFCNAVTDWNSLNPTNQIFMGATESDQRNELAAFFGNALHESNEFKAPREYSQCGATITDNDGKVYCKPVGYHGGTYTDPYCSATHTSTSDPEGCDCLGQVPESAIPGFVEADLLFFGRGALQKSHNYNYIMSSAALGVDFCSYPDLVATNSQYIWSTAFWFWTSNTGVAGKTCGQAVAEGSFGSTLKTINGGLECPAVGTHYGSVTSRLNYYCAAASALNVDSLLSFDGCDGLQEQFDQCLLTGWCSQCNAWGPSASPTPPQPTQSPTTHPPTLEPTTAPPTVSPTHGPTPDPNKFYINWDIGGGKCVQNCVGDAPCSDRYATQWETKFSDVRACCAQLWVGCPSQSEPCRLCTDADISAYATTTVAPVTTIGATVDTSTFYLSYEVDASGKCVQNCEGDPPCGGVNTDSWVHHHSDVQECCRKALPWKCNSDLPCEACTDADLSAFTTTTTTQATTTTTATSVDISAFYVSYAPEDTSGKCVQNCNGDKPCGGVNTESWVKKYSNAKECCDNGLSWKALEQCTDADVSAYITTTTKPPPQGIFYIDWGVGKCVEDCITGEAHCGGPPTYQQHHPDVATCCQQHLSYMCNGSFPCSACTDVPF